jgi:hypothetical protein
MANILPRQVEYIATESDMRQQVGKILSDRFIKDYVAIKQNIGGTIDQTNANSQTIETLDGRLDVAEAGIALLDGRVDAVETNLTEHVNAESAHGATGNIVGTDDYATAILGGVVLLAAAVADASGSTITPPADVTAAGATYTQVYAQEQTDAINALRQNVIDLVAANNALVAVVNQMLATERTAKQRAL